MSITRLAQGVDQFGMPIIGAIPQGNYINGYHFTAAGTATDTPPSGANFVLVAASGQVSVYVTIGGAATGPYTGNNTSGGASEVNPLIRQLLGATGVGIAVGAACDVSLSYFS